MDKQNQKSEAIGINSSETEKKVCYKWDLAFKKFTERTFVLLRILEKNNP